MCQVMLYFYTDFLVLSFYIHIVFTLSILMKFFKLNARSHEIFTSFWMLIFKLFAEKACASITPYKFYIWMVELKLIETPSLLHIMLVLGKNYYFNCITGQ